MKLSKRILKAINEGVYRALANLDDEEDTILTKSDIDLSRADIRYNRLIFPDKVEDFLNSPEHLLSELEEIIELSKKLHVKYVVNTKDTLISIIKICKNLTKNLNWLDISNITDISNLFAYDETFNCDISEWDVSNIVNAENAFAYCEAFNCDLSNWTLYKLENGKSMFACCSSLLYAPTLPNMALTPKCYYNMFSSCTSLKKAPGLPAITLAKACYLNMFYGCKNLEEAPVLPATTLVDSCYYGMFCRCTHLEEAPKLPATTLATYCYCGMFLNCISLTHAPELPAATLANDCYCFMFSGCKRLEKAPILPALTLSASCYCNMFEYCTNIKCIKCLAINNVDILNLSNILYKANIEGIFYKIKGVEYPKDVIPASWDIREITQNDI